MNDISVLIGGKAGDGINQAGLLIARMLNRIGYRIYIYFDYPSLIRGGHNFSIIRASQKKIAAHRDKVDYILALNQDCISMHKERLKKDTSIIFDSNSVKTDGLGLSIKDIIREENAPIMMRNSCIIGAFLKAAGVEWKVLEDVFRKNIPRDLELNLKIAKRGYDGAKLLVKIERLSQKSLPVLTGNEAIGLGLVKGGLDAYVAYPMTPSSSLLHFIAKKAEDFSLKVVHPESEIGVILMALGFSYAGKKTAVGTSGGGFCLMTEGLSLSAMAELPVVIIVSQRPGPSTGVPTYTAQGDLHFVLNAGHGEFARLVVAPGDNEEAYVWSQIALNLSCKYRIPSILLTDKALSEGNYSFDPDSIEEVKKEASSMVFPPKNETVIKTNSYAHDEHGITTEDPQLIETFQDKRMEKEKYLKNELGKKEVIKIYGRRKARRALLCWGSNKGVCVETAGKLGMKVIQPIVLLPFPVKEFKKAVKGIKRLIAVENNSGAQLANLVSAYGFCVDEKILKYDGRPFTVEELERRLKKVLK